ncbi:hypothetical protein GBF35_49415 [Nonomuraea phyllanthi]|uniref:hypothetical protein n=1 Tax=Nonomuraea phyllanthi TaxID=2219224 RepID=UPI001293CB79|nr:hypothetical protein [Nonomuraea phyllanthi]QFY13525.1 hypothetical protein GBF35_49415 [Nonomuraea phyllanthi]
MRAWLRRSGAVVVTAAALAVAPSPPATADGAPKNSGNTWNSGNYRAKGRNLNSGNFSNANGSVKSNNVNSGANYANGRQCVNERRSVVKHAC